MPFRPAPTRRASSATQSEIAISRVLADMGSADQLAHADPAIRVACPVCEALSHQRCLERNPKQYVTPHAERAALIPGAAALPVRRSVFLVLDFPASCRTGSVGLRWPRVAASDGAALGLVSEALKHRKRRICRCCRHQGDGRRMHGCHGARPPCVRWHC